MCVSGSDPAVQTLAEHSIHMELLNWATQVWHSELSMGEWVNVGVSPHMLSRGVAMRRMQQRRQSLPSRLSPTGLCWDQQAKGRAETVPSHAPTPSPMIIFCPPRNVSHAGALAATIDDEDTRRGLHHDRGRWQASFSLPLPRPPRPPALLATARRVDCTLSPACAPHAHSWPRPLRRSSVRYAGRFSTILGGIYAFSSS